MPERVRRGPPVAAVLTVLALAAAPPRADAQDVDPGGDPLAQDFGAPGFLLTRAERARIRDAEAAAQRTALVRETGTDGDTDGGKASEAEQKSPLEPVYVSGMVRLSASTWTVWLDRTRLSPRTQGRGPFTVRWIGDNRVRLTWDPPDRKARYTFTLGPKQSFIPATGRVVDGRAAAPRSVSVVGGTEAAPDGEGDGNAGRPQTAAQGGSDGGG